MDLELMKTLLAGKRVKKAPSFKNGYALIRTESGLSKVPITPEIRAALGKHEGKQGTVRRSSKGASRIQANGRRYYVAPYPTDVEVVSYRIR